MVQLSISHFQSMKGNKILVCDDDRDILDITQMLLMSKGFETRTLSDSLQVRETVDLIRPDALVIDIWMPIMSGLEVIRMLRADPGNKLLPIIAFSASAGSRLSSLQAGADAFVEKPFTIEQLSEEILKAIAKNKTTI